MEKNKNRTDLLAAGRKKLQQFRQKKDVKGNNSKSSNKAGKSGRDKTAGTVSEAAVTQQQHATDEEISKLDKTADTIPIPESCSGVDSVASDTAAGKSEHDIPVGIDTEAAVAQHHDEDGDTSKDYAEDSFALSESSSRVDSVACDTAAATHKLAAKDGIEVASLDAGGHKVDSGVSQKDASSSLVPEDANNNTPSLINREKSADDSISVPIDFSTTLDVEHGEEQVTDVGVTMEAVSSSGYQIDQGTMSLLEGDGDPGDSMVVDSGNTPGEEETHVATRLSKTDDASLTGSVINDAKEGQEGDKSIDSNEEKAEIHDVSGANVDLHRESTQASSGFVDIGRLSEFGVKDNAHSLACKQVDLSSVLDGSVIKLSQLADILRVLDEDEFRFLFMSTELSVEKLRDTNKMKAHDSVLPDSLERLKEHLYVTSFSNDALHLQLSEHQMWIDEVCALNSSLVEVQEKNELFSKEIVQCRYELQEIVSEREELRKQLQLSKAEVEVFAAKVNELQNDIEMAQGEMSSISSELVGYRNLVEALQAENKKLNESCVVLDDEKKQLSEENGSLLLEKEKMAGELSQLNAALESQQTLLRNDRKLLEEENDALVRENHKLLADLAEYKNKVEVLEQGNLNLKDILTSVSEERNKLENEKASAAHQFEKLSTELIDCKNLVANLQTEISNLNGQLTSMTEERVKLEEEKNRIGSESEKQSHVLMKMKVLESDLQTECRKAVDELKEARTHINQLTEENEILNADIEFHKCKVKELAQEKYSSQFEEVAKQGIENDIFTLQKPKSESSSSLEQQKLDVYDDPGFVALRRNLEDATTVMQQLEKEIEGMHLHSTSLSGSTAPGVSKLIQAFESKSQADDQDLEEPIPSEVHTNEDPYVRTKMVTQNLRLLLKKLMDDTENASEFCRVIQSKLLADATRVDRSKYDLLEEHSDQVEEANIELMVLYEAMRENFHRAVAKEGELRYLCDTQKKQEIVLKSENSQLQEKLNDILAQIIELQNLLDGFYGDSIEVVASISNQLQSLQVEVANRGLILEEEWLSFSAQAVQAVGRLDSTIKNFYSKSLAGGNGKLDVAGCVAASIDCTSKVIEALHGQLDTSKRDCQTLSDKTDVALNILLRLYNELGVLLKGSFGYHPDEAEHVVFDDRVLELLHPDVFDSLLEQLKIQFSQRLELESENKQLSSELMSRVRETDELQKNCLKSDTILRLIEEINQSVWLEGTMVDDDEPASRLESLIHLLVQKYREADHRSSVCSSLEMQLSDLRGQVEQLNIVLVQYENENVVFKQSLKTSEEDIIALKSKIQEKGAELEQAEQRVSSLREKLSIAVTKGKGLISQRDSLKQSLADTSKELEKCSQELLSKDARLHDLETKLEVYSEAGERMEALESELSYIRNSATALRESFLLKDSVLQRIEEILEDLELPEHFHSRDIIEKIDWLAKSVGGNSLPLGDWEQRSSVGGSHSDAGFVGVDGLKEDMQPNPNSSDDIRRRFEELQNKFYGLAEQNDMLEQSLLERNNLVQRWEEILDKIDLPSQLRSMEPEDKIRWLESALSEAQNRCYSLQQKIDNLENSCGSLTADVEDSQRRTSELETAFQKACIDKEELSKDLEKLRHDSYEISNRAADFKVKNENLQNEVNMLQEQKLQMEEDIHHTEDAIKRLQELVKEALGDSYTEYVVLGQEGIEHFEEMLRKLLEKYMTLISGKPVTVDSIGDHVADREANEGEDVVTLSKKLEDSMGEVMCLKEEKNGYMLNNQSLLRDVEELERKKKELEDLLNQEEHKSASLREKLNFAVRKGKSLVQQRDGMKQMIEELNAEIERLKADAKLNEKAISESEEQVKNLFAAHERVQVVESENSFLRDRLAENERSLQENESSWSSILEALSEIDAGLEANSGNPIENIKKIGKYLHDLHRRLDFLEQESKKSKRAAELLLAELNEVQERNDSLQDELEKAAHGLSVVSREKELAENAKNEALAHVEKLSYIQADERDKHLSEMTVLKSDVENMRDDLSAIERELGDVLSKDLEVLYNMKAMVESFLEKGGTPVFNPPFPVGSSNVTSTKSDNMVFMTQMGSLREILQNHSHLLQKESSRLAELVMNIHREFTSHKELCDTLKRDVKKLQLDENVRESELHTLQGNISLLYETCTSAISKLENCVDHAARNALASRAPERNLKSQIQIEGGNSFIDDTHIFSEESIRSMCNKLLLILGDFISMQNELMEVGQGEMKNTIMNLQKELQEKDIQRERICMELVNQIKEAEANAKNHLHDLQQARAQVHDSERKLDVMKEEHQVLEQRMKELQDQETNSIDLQQKVNSLTDALAAKVQEAEALMQALDEEEVEMENLSNKTVQLENELQQKNKDLENLEASRAKALKKLSVTVSKFDELHYLSENLLSEVEKLQSQLQEKDGEISFLRQEVTRCTNDALAVTHMSKKRSSDEIQDLLSWFDSSISRIPVHDLASHDSKNLMDNKYKEVLQKKILDLNSQLENLRVVTQNKDVLLQEERNRVEELIQKEQLLKNSLRTMESQVLMLQGAEDSTKAATSEIVEVEQMTNKWASSGTIAPQVRSLRKTNNDQVAIAIDVDDSRERLEDDDDDDKAHGFKSLTTSKIVPRFTRPVSDMVDGLWVSCDRALMRQPALRLGVMIYWAVLHAMLAVFFV